MTDQPTPLAAPDEEPEDGYIPAAESYGGDDDEFLEGDIEVDLEGIEAITGFVPVPNGVYVLDIARARLGKTKDKTGHNVLVTLRVAEGEFAGRTIGTDQWYVPNKKVQSPQKYKTTAGFFKGRIEAVMDAPWDGRLNVQDLVERKFKAIVQNIDAGFGPRCEVSTYLPYSADVSNVQIPQATVVRPQRDNGGGAAAAPTGGGQPGRFRI